jgi:tubulin monoglycylase TTLL3/8
MRATWSKIDPLKRINTFEVLGLDFMISDDFKVYLIEVNTNPCLELSSPLLARLIPTMLDNAFRIVIDPMYPPPEGYSLQKKVISEIAPENRFWLVFDEQYDGQTLEDVFRKKESVIVEIDDEELLSELSSG